MAVLLDRYEIHLTKNAVALVVSPPPPPLPSSTPIPLQPPDCTDYDILSQVMTATVLGDLCYKSITMDQVAHLFSHRGHILTLEQQVHCMWHKKRMNL